jgi:hypothetical protein
MSIKCKKNAANKIRSLAFNFAQMSNFDTTDTFKLGDTIISEWTIRKNTFWWRGKIIKITNNACDFGKKCRVYILKYQPCKYFPNGKIMKHCFIDEMRLFDNTGEQLVSYYIESS